MSYRGNIIGEIVAALNDSNFCKELKLNRMKLEAIVELVDSLIEGKNQTVTDNHNLMAIYWKYKQQCELQEGENIWLIS